jgi:hypothetical protein
LVAALGPPRRNFIAGSIDARPKPALISPQGNGQMTKLIIGVLLAIVLVLLYRGMRQEQASVDPAAPLDAKKILAVLRGENLPCDNVDSFTPLGRSIDNKWDGYLSRCHSGGRYIYFESRPKGQVGAVSCKDEAFHNGYRCPQ